MPDSLHLPLPAAAILAGLFLASLSAPAAAADPFRLRAAATPAHAVGGYQQRELGYGVGLSGVGEYAFSPKLAAGLKLGYLWLGEGKAPADAGVKPEGAASAYSGAFEVVAYPLATSVNGESFSPEGLWFSVSAGAVGTGGTLRGAFDVFAGWDLVFPAPSWGFGPTVGLLHAFQPNREDRPEDANVAMVGLQLRCWPQPSRGPKAPADRDGDGIPDERDRCPDAAEDLDSFADTDGCPDLDNDQDGVPDLADRCPLQPEDVDHFEDEDGCPDLDNDQDGVPDAADRCPKVVEDQDGFEDDDGCPDPDNDRDGVPDLEDLCPAEPENQNGYADGDGCPDEDQVRVVSGKIVLDERVHFPENSAFIERTSHPLLERLAKLLREHPEYIHISVEGHADERGTEALNQRLSLDSGQGRALVPGRPWRRSHPPECGRIRIEPPGGGRQERARLLHEPARGIRGHQSR